MPAYTDALRGYGFPIHQRDEFLCKYCGWDCSLWPNWLYLSVDHLLPKGHALRDSDDYIVTSCLFCNTADNWYFSHAEKRGLKFDGMFDDELVEQRRPYVTRVRQDYRTFWEKHVGLERNETCLEK